MKLQHPTKRNHTFTVSKEISKTGKLQSDENGIVEFDDKFEDTFRRTGFQDPVKAEAPTPAKKAPAAKADGSKKVSGKAPAKKAPPVPAKADAGKAPPAAAPGAEAPAPGAQAS